MKKRFWLTLLIMIVSVVGLVACGSPYKKLSLDVSTSNVVLYISSDPEDSSKLVKESTTITANVSGKADKSVDKSIFIPYSKYVTSSIISSIDGSIEFSLTAANIGSTDITLTSAEGNLKSIIHVEVKLDISGLSFNTTNLQAIQEGGSINFATNSNAYLNFYPDNTSEKDVEYEIVDEGIDVDYAYFENNVLYAVNGATYPQTSGNKHITIRVTSKRDSSLTDMIELPVVSITNTKNVTSNGESDVIELTQNALGQYEIVLAPIKQNGETNTNDYSSHRSIYISMGTNSVEHKKYEVNFSNTYSKYTDLSDCAVNNPKSIVGIDYYSKNDCFQFNLTGLASGSITKTIYIDYSTYKGVFTQEIVLLIKVINIPFASQVTINGANANDYTQANPFVVYNNYAVTGSKSGASPFAVTEPYSNVSNLKYQISYVNGGYDASGLSLTSSSGSSMLNQTASNGTTLYLKHNYSTMIDGAVPYITISYYYSMCPASGDPDTYETYVVSVNVYLDFKIGVTQEDFEDLSNVYLDVTSYNESNPTQYLLLAVNEAVDIQDQIASVVASNKDLFELEYTDNYILIRANDNYLEGTTTLQFIAQNGISSPKVTLTTYIPTIYNASVTSGLGVDMLDRTDAMQLINMNDNTQEVVSNISIGDISYYTTDSTSAFETLNAFVMATNTTTTLNVYNYYINTHNELISMIANASVVSAVTNPTVGDSYLTWQDGTLYISGLITGADNAVQLVLAYTGLQPKYVTGAVDIFDYETVTITKTINIWIYDRLNSVSFSSGYNTTLYESSTLGYLDKNDSKVEFDIATRPTTIEGINQFGNLQVDYFVYELHDITASETPIAQFNSSGTMVYIYWSDILHYANNVLTLKIEDYKMAEWLSGTSGYNKEQFLELIFGSGLTAHIYTNTYQFDRLVAPSVLEVKLTYATMVERISSTIGTSGVYFESRNGVLDKEYVTIPYTLLPNTATNTNVIVKIVSEMDPTTDNTANYGISITKTITGGKVKITPLVKTGTKDLVIIYPEDSIYQSDTDEDGQPILSYTDNGILPLKIILRIGDGTENNMFQIRSFSDLERVRTDSISSSTNTISGSTNAYYYQLASNIYAANYTLATLDTIFNGYLTGRFSSQGTQYSYGIYNLNINSNISNTTSQNVGLFSIVGRNGVIENLIMQDSVINVTLACQENEYTGELNVGSLAGISYGKISSCIVSSNIVVNAYSTNGLNAKVNCLNTDGSINVGGIVGKMSFCQNSSEEWNSVEINNYNMATNINNSNINSNVSIVVYAIESETNKINIGGVVGYAGMSTSGLVIAPIINGVSVLASIVAITPELDSYVTANIGGIAGSTVDLRLDNSTISPILKGKSNVGGMIGLSNRGVINNSSVQLTYNDILKNVVLGETNVGGIIGLANSQTYTSGFSILDGLGINNSYVRSYVRTDVTNDINAYCGNVVLTGTLANAKIGGLVGLSSGVTISLSSSYFDGDIQSLNANTDFVGGLIGSHGQNVDISTAYVTGHIVSASGNYGLVSGNSSVTSGDTVPNTNITSSHKGSLSNSAISSGDSNNTLYVSGTSKNISYKNMTESYSTTISFSQFYANVNENKVIVNSASDEITYRVPTATIKDVDVTVYYLGSVEVDSNTLYYFASTADINTKVTVSGVTTTTHTYLPSLNCSSLPSTIISKMNELYLIDSTNHGNVNVTTLTSFTNIPTISSTTQDSEIAALLTSLINNGSTYLTIASATTTGYDAVCTSADASVTSLTSGITFADIYSTTSNYLAFSALFNSSNDVIVESVVNDLQETLTVYEETVWAISSKINNGNPILGYSVLNDNDVYEFYGLYDVVPFISATALSIIDSTSNSQGHIKVSDDELILFYSQTSDTSSSINNYTFVIVNGTQDATGYNKSSVIQINYASLDITNLNLTLKDDTTITTSDSNVVAVNYEGSQYYLTTKGLGDAVITIRSTYDSTVYAQININVVTAFTDMHVYSYASSQKAQIQSMSQYVDDLNLYSVEYDNYYYITDTNHTSTYISYPANTQGGYVLNIYPGIQEGIENAIIEVNGNILKIDGTTSLKVNSLGSLSIKANCRGQLRIIITPYITITSAIVSVGTPNEYVLTDLAKEYLFTSYNKAQSMNVQGNTSATLTCDDTLDWNIEIISTNNLGENVNGETLSATVIINNTNTIYENAAFYGLDSLDSNLTDSPYIIQVTTSRVGCELYGSTSSGVTLYKITYKLSIAFDSEKYYDLLSKTNKNPLSSPVKYTFIVQSNSNAELQETIDVTMQANTIQRIDNAFYPANESLLETIKGGNNTQSVYNPQESSSTYIVPGETGLLKLAPVKQFNNIATLDVVAVQNAQYISLKQVVENKNFNGVSDNQKYLDLQYPNSSITNGIRLFNVSYTNVSNGISSVYFANTYYVQVKLSNLVPQGGIVSFHINALDSNGNIIYTETISLDIEYLPTIDIKVNNTTTYTPVALSSLSNITITASHTENDLKYSINGIEDSMYLVTLANTNELTRASVNRIYANQTYYLATTSSTPLGMNTIIVSGYRVLHGQKIEASGSMVVHVVYATLDTSSIALQGASNTSTGSVMSIPVGNYSSILLSSTFNNNDLTKYINMGVYDYNNGHGYFSSVSTTLANKIAAQFSSQVDGSTKGGNITITQADNDYNVSTVCLDGATSINNHYYKDSQNSINLVDKYGYPAASSNLTNCYFQFFKYNDTENNELFFGLNALNVGICDLQITFYYYYDENGVIQVINYTGSTDANILNTYLANGYQVYSYTYDYKLKLVDSSDEDAPLPITSQAELKAMNAGVHYILTNDITLDDWAPMQANMASLDGNGYVITINSFDLTNIGTSANVGIFTTIGGDQTDTNGNEYITIIKNLTINISPLLSAENNTSITSLTTGLSSVTDLTFGILAVENDGSITNCKVVNLNSETAGYYFKVHTSQTLGNSATIGGLVAINTGSISNSFVGQNYATTDGSITLAVNNSISETATNGVAAKPFATYPFVISGGNKICGFVATNSGTITSCYVKGVSVQNITERVNNSMTAGFVNNNTGKIYSCFIEQGVGDGNGIFTGIRASEDYFVKSVGNIGGFVYSNGNNGIIKNAYAKITIATNSANTGGFVYSSAGTIEYCYTTATNENSVSLAHSPFISVAFDSAGKQVCGTITNCYYLVAFTTTKETPSSDDDWISERGGTYNSDNLSNMVEALKLLDPATALLSKIGTSDSKNTRFLTSSAFEGFTFSKSSTDETGIWIMDATKTVGPQLASCLNYDTTSIRALMSSSERTEDGKTVIDYSYQYLNGYNLGTSRNPIVAFSAQSFAKNIVKYSLIHTYKNTNVAIFGGRTPYSTNSTATNSLFAPSYVRIVDDIDLSTDILTNKYEPNSQIQNESFSLSEVIFMGVLMGNGLTLNNIKLNSVSTVDNYGLFAQIGLSDDQANALYMTNVNTPLVYNLNINYDELSNINAQRVGVLAGSIYNSTIYMVSINGASDTESTDVSEIVGANIVGGLAGVIIGSNTTIANITIGNIKLHANKRTVNNLPDTYVDRFGYYNEFYDSSLYTVETATGTIKATLFNGESNYSSVSYSGGIAGIIMVENYTQKSKIEDTDTSATLINEYRTSEASQLQNLLVKDNVIITADNVGGLFGYVGNNTHIKFSAFQLTNATNSYQYLCGYNYAGGIVGELQGGILEQVYICYDETTQTTIDAKMNNKNFVSTDAGTTKLFYGRSETDNQVMVSIGGLAAYSEDAIIIDCYSKVNVMNAKAKVAGGLVGIANENNYFGYDYTLGNVTGKDVIGGLIGFYRYSSYSLYLNNTYALNHWDSSVVTSLQNNNSSIYGNVNATNEVSMPEIGNQVSTISSGYNTFGPTTTTGKRYVYIGSVIGKASLNVGTYTIHSDTHEEELIIPSVNNLPYKIGKVYIEYNGREIASCNLTDLFVLPFSYADDDNIYYYNSSNKTLFGMSLFTVESNNIEIKKNLLQVSALKATKNVNGSLSSATDKEIVGGTNYGLANNYYYSNESNNVFNNNVISTTYANYTSTTSASGVVSYTFTNASRLVGIGGVKRVLASLPTDYISDSLEDLVDEDSMIFYESVLGKQEYLIQATGLYQEEGLKDSSATTASSVFYVNEFNTVYGFTFELMDDSSSSFKGSSVWYVKDGNYLPTYSLGKYSNFTDISSASDLEDIFNSSNTKGKYYSLTQSEYKFDYSGKDLTKSSIYNNVLSGTFVGDSQSNSKIIFTVGSSNDVASIFKEINLATFINVDFEIIYNRATPKIDNSVYIGLFANKVISTVFTKCNFTVKVDPSITLSVGRENVADSSFGLVFGLLSNSNILSTNFTFSTDVAIANEDFAFVGMIAGQIFSGQMNAVTVTAGSFNVTCDGTTPSVYSIGVICGSNNFGTMSSIIVIMNNLQTNITSSVMLKTGIIGNANNAKINTITITSKITSTYSSSTAYIGKILGYGTDTPIVNAKIGNNQLITATCNNSANTTYLGGMVGYGDALTIRGNSTQLQYSDIQISGNVKTLYIGGFIGWSRIASSSAVLIDNAINDGNISINTDKNNSATIIAGGMVGYMGGGLLQNVLNTGNIKYLNGYGNTYYMGGLIGQLDLSGANITMTSLSNYGEILYSNVNGTNVSRKPLSSSCGIVGKSAQSMTLNNSISFGRIYANTTSELNTEADDIWGNVTCDSTCVYIKEYQPMLNNGAIGVAYADLGSTGTFAKNSSLCKTGKLIYDTNGYLPYYQLGGVTLYSLLDNTSGSLNKPKTITVLTTSISGYNLLSGSSYVSNVTVNPGALLTGSSTSGVTINSTNTNSTLITSNYGYISNLALCVSNTTSSSPFVNTNYNVITNCVVYGETGNTSSTIDCFTNTNNGTIYECSASIMFRNALLANTTFSGFVYTNNKVISKCSSTSGIEVVPNGSATFGGICYKNNGAITFAVYGGDAYGLTGNSDYADVIYSSVQQLSDSCYSDESATTNGNKPFNSSELMGTYNNNLGYVNYSSISIPSYIKITYNSSNVSAITYHNTDNFNDYVVSCFRDILRLGYVSARYVYLTKDLDFKNYSTQTLNSMLISTIKANGIFESNGTENFRKTISNITTTRLVSSNYGTIRNIILKNINSDTSVSNNALIYSNASGAKISNITIDSIRFNGVTGNASYGSGIINQNSGTITDVVVNNISISSASANTGAICGNNSGTITNCSVTNANINTTQDYTGGLVGKNSGNITTSSISGLTLSGGSYVGGICGSNSGVCGSSNVNNQTITNANINGTTKIGGVCGNNTGTIQYYKVKKDSNSYCKIISSDSVVGGVVGYNNSNVNNCEFESNNNSTLQIIAPNGYIGGIVGYSEGGTINYNIANNLFLNVINILRKNQALICGYNKKASFNSNVSTNSVINISCYTDSDTGLTDKTTLSDFVKSTGKDLKISNLYIPSDSALGSSSYYQTIKTVTLGMYNDNLLKILTYYNINFLSNIDTQQGTFTNSTILCNESYALYKLNYGTVKYYKDTAFVYWWEEAWLKNCSLTITGYYGVTYTCNNGTISYNYNKNKSQSSTNWGGSSGYYELEKYSHDPSILSGRLLNQLYAENISTMITTLKVSML